MSRAYALRKKPTTVNVLTDSGIHCHISQTLRYKQPVDGKHEMAVRQGIDVNVAEILRYGDVETKLRDL